MKYNININQKGLVDAGLDVDLIDAAIMVHILDFFHNPKATFLDGHVWINYGHTLEELPLLPFKTKQAVSLRIRRLVKQNLFTEIKDKDTRLYLKPTPFLIDAFLTTRQAELTPRQESLTPPSSQLDIQQSITKEHITRAFDEFWKVYPKKVGRPAAEKAFPNCEPFLKAIKNNIALRLKSGEWDKSQLKFIPNPSTYLNQKRWLDEPLEKTTKEFLL